ncbi:hypothetical protein A8B76_05030 [Roseovarius indicus]|nr:hypothetical protein A8B76_05030 [Roseovarius indicus]
MWSLRRDEAMIAHMAQIRADARESGAMPEALAGGERLFDGSFARIIDRVAVVPVWGLLLRRFNWFTWSSEEIRRDVDAAKGDSRVDAIVLDIDSPGGLAAGVDDLTEWLRDARGGDKPLEAFVGGMAASAAYNVASAASRITMGSSALAGSIGAVIEYVDMEPMLEAMGARIVRIVSEQSPNKRLDPESPEGKAEMQAIVDAAGADFVASVAAGRGVSEAQVLDRFGQGLVFSADEAVSRGLADRRGTLEALIAELAGRGDTTGAAPAAAAMEDPEMDWDKLTAAALREHRPDIATELEEAALTGVHVNSVDEDALRAEGAEAERKRLAEIDEVAVAGHDDLVAKAKADGKSTAADVALQIVKADKAAGKTHVDGLRAVEDALDPPPSDAPGANAGGTSEPDAHAPIEDRAKAQWNKDASLRAEFADDFDSFLAFAKADEAGRARIRAVN